ncbi:hypothetical protein GCM10011611_10050 [Aliidongia dinghuensis]|uniref:Uncharacterized protein n=1 Tax=Aliidongia dinghuensis TaxID=1867774 RepID=A0A8J3E103_9PROT|nr:hypothetical protein GCM10011611_10050 [Aliidongia dinghuensis]
MGRERDGVGTDFLCLEAASEQQNAQRLLGRKDAFDRRRSPAGNLSAVHEDLDACRGIKCVERIFKRLWRDIERDGAHCCFCRRSGIRSDGSPGKARDGSQNQQHTGGKAPKGITR